MLSRLPDDDSPEPADPFRPRVARPKFIDTSRPGNEIRTGGSILPAWSKAKAADDPAPPARVGGYDDLFS